MYGPSYPPFYGGATGYRAGSRNPARGTVTLPQGAGDWAQNLAGLRGGLGQSAGEWGFRFSTLAGAAVGGGLVGWVASKRGMDGAKRGAVFSTGLTGVAEGFRSWRGSPLVGASLAAGGMLGLWWVLKKM